MSRFYSIRPAVSQDELPLTQLFRRSYPALLRADYEAHLLDRVLPMFTVAQAALLNCGTYFVAECKDTGRLVGAGGWTDVSPARGVFQQGQGHVRHVATDPDWLRLGIARALMGRSFETARDYGINSFNCMSTRTARSFYEAIGFCERGEIELEITPGLYFPVIQMVNSDV
ncbi:GNAT family N-acetyltransferase [Shimia abyssi]|uniref:Acetyltransferase (GNAT) family protein n=1 Tax=Shimia abyssi TaxID=1662395 RepID=A0A2P8FL09_9RHOB|nr:GNAT family N-acetyltransferase [Shimia abyssi]PSL22355.1 acetyltransferase (GNAT) family protein [Shimia abyssi]